MLGGSYQAQRGKRQKRAFANVISKSMLGRVIRANSGRNRLFATIHAETRYNLGAMLAQEGKVADSRSNNLEAREDATQPMTALAAHAAEQAREMLHAGVAGDKILNMLVNAAEDVAGRGSAVCSILVLDKQGLLRNAASPNLPADYLAAIDRLKPNPSVGTCSAAAATGLVVVTCDFKADDKWAELRHLPMSLGFSGAWSMPIKAGDGTVLGTLGTYFRERRSPTQEELTSVAVLAAAAGIVLAGQEKRT